MIKYFLSFVLLAFCVNAEDYDRKDVDSYELLLKMSEEKNFLFAKEMLELRDSLKGTSLRILADGVLAYRAGKAEEGAELFFSIKEGNPYFKLMFHTFRRVASDYPGTSKANYDRLARLAFETSLRDIQELENGCVIGLLSHYKKLVENEPVKKAEFDKWLAKKWQEFYDAEPGNWYHFIGYGFHVDQQKLQAVTEPVESVLLGFQKPYEKFNEDLYKVYSLKAEFMGRVEVLRRHILDLESVSSLLEELRLHVLAGKVEIVKKSLPMLRDKVESFVLSIENPKDQTSVRKNLLGKYFYIKGVHQYLQARNKMLKDRDVREDIIGRKGALVSLHFAGRKGGDSIWVKKARKLYEHIQSQTQEWFGVSIQNFDYWPKEEK